MMLKGTSLILALLGLVACSEDVVVERTPKVVVQDVFSRTYQPEYNFVGRLEAPTDVDITANVTAYIKEMAFLEGQRVEAGALLFRLDDSELNAAMASAKAELASAEATAANATRNYKRGQELLPKGAISQSEVDDLQAKQLEAGAAISGARARVESAKVNLDYATIRAPVDGRIGRSIASVGDLVGPSWGPLTTLVSIDPIYALFSVSESTYVAKVSEARAQGKDVASNRPAGLQVTIEMSGGYEYEHVGHIDYFGNRVDLNTGTIEGRAVIPNPEAILVPGQYVSVNLKEPVEIQGTFLAQAAVQVDQQGNFVLSVDTSGVVVRHNVELGERYGDYVVIKQGIDPGRQVITRGLQQVREGMVVEATRIENVQDTDDAS